MSCGYKWVFVGLALMCLFGEAPAQAQTLDDQSIKAFLAEDIAAVRAHDPEKMRQHMEQITDDNFKVESSTLEIIDNAPPQTSIRTLNRQEAIAGSIHQASAADIQSYDDQLLDVQYSADHKKAVIKDSSTITAIVHLEDGSSKRMREENKCTSALALVGTQIKVMQSSCSGRVVLKN